MELEQSHLGVYIDNIFCGAPTFADDMSLISSSPTDLQSMLQIVSRYAFKWAYTINPSKSQLIIYSQQSSVRTHLSQHFQWFICGQPIPVVTSAKHLGILLSPSSSTIERTTNVISSSRSAYYALSTVGAWHSGLNLSTSLQFYKFLCLPILTFGLEVWSPTSTELLMMEQSQLKILHTILGLPIRAPLAGIHLLLGTIPIKYIALYKQLSFIRSTWPSLSLLLLEGYCYSDHSPLIFLPLIL